MSAFWLISEIACYIINAILIAISLCLIASQWTQNDQMYMKKRSISLYYALNLSLTFGMAALVMMLVALLHLENKLWVVIVLSVCLLCLFSCLYFLLTKSWMVFYKYKWTYYTMQLQWSYIINSKSAVTSSETNWFIVNHKTYGNLWYVYKLFAVFFLMGSTIAAAAAALMVYSDFQMIVFIPAATAFACVMILVFGFYTYLIKSTPLLKDTYKIHWESRVHVKCLVTCEFVDILATVAFIVYPSIKIWLFAVVPQNVCLLAMVYLSTYHLSRLQSQNIGVATKTHLRDITVDMTLANESAIHAFMVHLSKEYSMEVLLSYIEFIQFQKYVTDRLQDEKLRSEVLDKTKLTDFEFPANIPLSEIIESEQQIVIDVSDSVDVNDMLLNEAKIKAHKLYNKYIDTGSEFEINISAVERQKMSDLLSELDDLLTSNINLKDLILSFEDCKQEMKMLLGFSMIRFKQEAECGEITMELQ